MNENSLRETEGKKIRRQYLNIFIWFEIVCPLGLVIPMLVMNTLWGDAGTKLASWSQIFSGIICVDFVLVFPIVVISLLNRFLFGKTVCVLTDDGVCYQLHGQRCLTAWEEIETIEYCIRLWAPFMAGNVWCHARISVADTDVCINQVPFMFLRMAKKHNKKIKLRLDKAGIIQVVLSVAIPVAVSIVFGLLLIVN